MTRKTISKVKNIPHSSNDTIEVKIFKNKTNKQYTLPVLKKNISPKLIHDVLDNKDIVGLKFKITDVVLRNKETKGVGGRSPTVHPFEEKGGKK